MFFPIKLFTEKPCVQCGCNNQLVSWWYLQRKSASNTEKSKQILKPEAR